MAFNIRKAFALMKKEIQKDWKKLDFTFEEKGDEAVAKAKITLNNVDDDILVLIKMFSGSGIVFRVVFDKLDKTAESLNLINEFNRTGYFFKAFIRDDGYLELEHFFVCYEIDMCKNYAGEFLSRLGGLADNEELLALTNLTYAE